MRRLSATGIKNPTRRVRTAAPLLRQDQAHNETSAFVFGYRQTTTWKFYAQIVKGVMAATGIDALKDATDKVVPLDQAYEIA